MMKINKSSKQFKYYEAKKLGKSKKESALQAGYSENTARIPQVIEQSQAYQVIERHFKEELLGKITISEVADELVKNIRQDVQLGAKNEAIKIALNKIEPEDIPQDEEQVIILLK
jgi:phage terminase small subunit